MIQRKQTLFLFAAFLAYAICLFLPVASVEAQGMAAGVSVHCLGTAGGDSGVHFDSTCFPLFLLCAVSAVLSVVNIFMYNNRKLQMNMCGIILLFSVLWYVDYLVMFLGIVGLENATGNMQVNFGACLPLVSIILVALARKGVSDDEKLVRAADRIR